MKTQVINQVITKDYAIYQGDCCEVIKGFSDESIGMSIYSPPFADLYAYSDSDEDMGNCRSYPEFFKHFEFLVKELFRVLIPGRIVAVHCMDLPTHKSKVGYIGLSDFPGDLVKLFTSNNFIFHSRHCIWKDPLIAATRTHALGLAHKQIFKDSSMCRTGIADQILAFRKEGDNPIPCSNPAGLLDYAGKRPVPRDLLRYRGIQSSQDNKYSQWVWQQYASPVWMDIDQTRVLPFRQGKDKEDERHICPLQLQVIERCLHLWSTEGDKVLTPFAGVGSEVYEAVRLKRKGIGIELKPTYFRQAVRNLESLSKKVNDKGFNAI